MTVVMKFLKILSLKFHVLTRNVKKDFDGFKKFFFLLDREARIPTAS